MATVADVYRALNKMRDDGVIDNYAVCGGTAALFYATETLRTFDIDIFVIMAQSGLILSLKPIYDWARSSGFEIEKEHIFVHGVPVQVLLAGEGLELEAVETANVLDYDGVPVPVAKPEYLTLIYGSVGGRNRITRALDLIEAVPMDAALISKLVNQYHLENVWKRLEGESHDRENN